MKVTKDPRTAGPCHLCRISEYDLLVALYLFCHGATPARLTSVFSSAPCS